VLTTLWNMQWLSWVLTSGVSFIAGVLAELSPKRNWEFLKWPSIAVLVLSVLTAAFEPATVLSMGSPKFVCVLNPKWPAPGEELRICKFTPGTIAIKQNPKVWQRWKKVIVSVLEDIPLDIAAAFIGIGLAFVAARRRRSGPAP
jgi:hypothetical protein